MDIAFTRWRVAVFVDGCFWHACPRHGSIPKNNHEWWRVKLQANVLRDRGADQARRAAGWRVVRIWEHEVPGDAADRVVHELQQAITATRVTRVGGKCVETSEL